MQLGKSRRQKKIEREREWHLHFAWWPVRVANDDRRWLEPVLRRGDWKCDEYGWFVIYEYKPARAAKQAT